MGGDSSPRLWRSVGASLLLLITLAGCRSTSSLDASLNEARSAFERGRLSETVSAADRGLTAFKGPSDNPAVWDLRYLRAEALIFQRQLTEVPAVIAAPLPATPAFEALRLRQGYLSARLEVARGQLAQAAEIATRYLAQTPRESALALDFQILAGQVALQRGEWATGEAELKEALTAARQRGQRWRHELLTLLTLGTGYLIRARYDEALVWLEPALAMSDFEQTSLYATALANAGICYSRLGLFERAIKTQQRAVAIHRQNRALPALQLALGSLGITEGLRGDYQAALPFLEEAYQVADSIKQPVDAALWANNLASAFTRLGEWDRAEDLNNRSRAIAEHSDRLKPVYNTLAAAEIARGRGDIALAERLFKEASDNAGEIASVRWSAQVGLATVALAAGDSRLASRHFDTALDMVERTRSDLLKIDYKVSFLTQLIDFYQSYVDALVAEGRSDRALEVVESSRGRVLAELHRIAAPAAPSAASFRDVARRSRTVLLSYWLAPKRSFLWVVTETGVRRVDLPPAADIEAAVREYRAMLDNSTADPLARPGTAGDRLYTLLVAPAALSPHASVVIAPDGALHGINFETLPVDGPRRHYLIEDAEVQVTPSLAMLSRRGVSHQGDRSLLLIGNPTPRAPEFPALSYAPIEMTSIVRHFARDKVTAFDGGRATPAVYGEAALDQFSMIHFTAHATANVESPLDSAVVLSGPDSGYKLYARDVADKPLNADLVTVSACRSAGERAYSGEGLVGFAWAFLRAGARRVIAGLWDVDDRSTAKLMDALYGSLQGGSTPAAALRDAKLTLLNDGGQLARPYYWGPFQLFTVTP